MSMTYAFWFSARDGLVRRRSAPGSLHFPEVWRGGRWVRGTPYLLDAITGMGEDTHSSGDWVDRWDTARAEAHAAAEGIDLYAEPGDA